MVGLYATDEDFRKLVFGLLGKLNMEEYASIYTTMFYDIYAEDDARKTARDQYLAVLSDTTGHEAEYLLRIQRKVKMVNYMNKVQLMGRLTRNPELIVDIVEATAPHLILSIVWFMAKELSLP